MLKFTILTDNRPAPGSSTNCSEPTCNTCCPALLSEHGLSIFIEYNGTRILCDTGASPAFIENAAALGTNLTGTDFCVISHGHSDHTGGLPALLEKKEMTEITEITEIAGGKFCVYLSGQIKDEKYYSRRRGLPRDISTDPIVFEKYSNRLVHIGCSQWITPEIAVVKCSCSSHPKPHGNKFLGVTCCGHESTIISQEQSALPYLISDDQFGHELALAINTPQGVAIFSPCSHNGLFNIIESAMEFTGASELLAFVGGLHLVDGCETAQEISDMARTFAKKYPDAQLFTGHCTGDMATEIFSSIFSHDALASSPFHIFHTGFEQILS